MSEVNGREIKETPEIRQAIELPESEKRGFDEECSKQKVETSIDDKVTDIPTKELSERDKNSFKDGEYRTVVTDEPITVYRVYGGNSNPDGNFATTEKPFDALSTKMDSAIKPEWRNSKQYYFYFNTLKKLEER